MSAGNEQLALVNEQLERCKPWIEAALEYSGGTHNYDDIADSVRCAKMQLWPATKSCLVTEITQYPRKKVLHIFLAGGDLSEIKSMQDDVIRWAKRLDCEALTMTGRIGWSKALKDIGWETRLVLMEKVIE